MQTQYASTQTNQTAILHSLNSSTYVVDFPGFLFLLYFMTPKFIADSQLWEMNTSEVLVYLGCG